MWRVEHGGIDLFIKREENSSSWPSSNKKDRPTATFTCVRCGWTTERVMYGSFPIYQDPERKMLEECVFHYQNCPKKEAA